MWRALKFWKYLFGGLPTSLQYPMTHNLLVPLLIFCAFYTRSIECPPEIKLPHTARPICLISNIDWAQLLPHQPGHKEEELRETSDSSLGLFPCLPWYRWLERKDYVFCGNSVCDTSFCYWNLYRNKTKSNSYLGNAQSIGPQVNNG